MIDADEVRWEGMLKPHNKYLLGTSGGISNGLT